MLSLGVYSLSRTIVFIRVASTSRTYFSAARRTTHANDTLLASPIRSDSIQIDIGQEADRDPNRLGSITLFPARVLNGGQPIFHHLHHSGERVWVKTWK